MVKELRVFCVVWREHALGHCGAEGLGSKIGAQLLGVYLSREAAEEAAERERENAGYYDDYNWCRCGGWASPSPDPSFIEVIEGYLVLPDEVAHELEK